MAERTLEAFEAAHRAQWAELARIVAKGPIGQGGSAEGLVRTLSLVRLVSGDLAWARRRFAGTSVVGELEVLLTAARPLLDRPARRPAQLVADTAALTAEVLSRSRRAIALGGLVLVVAVAIGGLWAAADPGGAQAVLALHDRIPPEPGHGLPHVSGLPVGTPQSGRSWTVLDAGGAVVLALVGGALAGLGTVAVVLLAGLRLGVGLALALDAGQGARVLEGLGVSGLSLAVALVLGAAAGLTAASGVIGRRPLTAATTDAAVLGAIGLVLLLPALVGTLVARVDVVTGELVGAASLVLVEIGLAALTRAGRTPRTPRSQPAPAPPPVS